MGPMILPGAPGEDDANAVTAGLVNADNVCVNAILVTVDDNGSVVGYAAPSGLTLVVNPSAGPGKLWTGTDFVDPSQS
jgi:hypothetical protein